MQRYWNGKLLAITTKFECTIVHTTSVPLSLLNPDGSQRVTQKSKLMEVLSQYQEENDAVVEIDVKIFVVDFTVQIRVIRKEIPETYEQLALKVLHQYQKRERGSEREREREFFKGVYESSQIQGFM